MVKSQVKRKCRSIWRFTISQYYIYIYNSLRNLDRSMDLGVWIKTFATQSEAGSHWQIFGLEN